MFWWIVFSFLGIIVCTAVMIKSFYDISILIREHRVDMFDGVGASVFIFGGFGLIDYLFIRVIITFANQYPELF